MRCGFSAIEQKPPGWANLPPPMWNRVKSWEVSDIPKKKKPIPIVKGRLKNHSEFWERIGANETIVLILKEGYRIPFHTVPPSTHSPNNKSAYKHHDFASKAIKELLNTGRIKEVSHIPYVVNPLSVSEKCEKLRLILDLRLVNFHVYKDKIRFDDWKVMESYLDMGGFGFKFDITQGYHHIDIHVDFQKFLGFSWILDGVQNYFIFLVLPFGLTSAPYIFTKVVRVLVKFWRNVGIKICVFIDDGFGCAKSLGEAKSHSTTPFFFIRIHFIRIARLKMA